MLAISMNKDDAVLQIFGATALAFDSSVLHGNQAFAPIPGSEHMSGLAPPLGLLPPPGLPMPPSLLQVPPPGLPPPAAPFIMQKAPKTWRKADSDAGSGSTELDGEASDSNDAPSASYKSGSGERDFVIEMPSMADAASFVPGGVLLGQFCTAVGSPCKGVQQAVVGTDQLRTTPTSFHMTLESKSFSTLVKVAPARSWGAAARDARYIQVPKASAVAPGEAAKEASAVARTFSTGASDPAGTESTSWAQIVKAGRPALSGK
eukprot:TRINITY_DN5750_c0_g1_i12.p1 TRINITY_DN5750_c0_g1~~TRINITY_DN5750_c0_g1_i12.p1  ORF type:complete len:262 (-),score=66.15 TRINITY_DN5750_c0_g1_i12:26-811(-)